MDAAEERQRRLEDVAVTQAWLGAILARQKKIPKLEKLLARGEKPDVATYLEGLKAQLPGITMAEWRRRKGATSDTEAE